VRERKVTAHVTHSGDKYFQGNRLRVIIIILILIIHKFVRHTTVQSCNPNLECQCLGFVTLLNCGVLLAKPK